MGMEELTNFGKKNSLTLPPSANKYFNSLKDEDDESFYTYTDPFMRKFARKAVKGGRCNAFKQHCKSESSDEVFKNNPTELNVNGNICDILESISKFYTNLRNKMPKNSMQNMMIIEILIIKKKLILLTKN